MTFLNPLGFIWLAIAGPVILLYFLKLKRKKVRISSTWLWTRSIQDLRVNAPFQKLRKSLLLLLQLLLILLAVLALTEPIGSAAPPEEKRWVVLIDRSASMQMKETEPSRLEEAKTKARTLLEEIGPDDLVMIVSFANRAKIMTPFTPSRGEAEGAIDAIEPSDARSRIQDAYRIAVSALEGVPNGEIVIMSDGGFEPIQGADDEIEVRYLPIGGKVRNAAITALDVRAPVREYDPWTIFAQVDLFHDADVEVTVELQINGKLESVKKVKLMANAGTGVIFELDEPVPEIVQVTLDYEDDLDLDNRAWFAVRPERAKILLAGEDNFFLEKALAQYGEADAFRTPDLAQSSLRDFDVAVLDGIVPDALPEGRYLILGGVPKWEGIEQGAMIDGPDVVDWNRRHPLTRMVTFSDILVKQAPHVKLPGFATPVVEASETPLVFAWEKGRTRAVVVTFDLLESDWPFHLSFPLFIANALEWLRGDAENRARPGEPIRIRLAQDEKKIEVVGPGGAKETLSGPPGSDVVLGRTDRAGLYTITRGGETRPVAVNLFEPHESAGRVEDELRLGPGKMARSGFIGEPIRPYWRWLAFGVLLLLLGEWFVYHRRVEL